MAVYRPVLVVDPLRLNKIEPGATITTNNIRSMRGLILDTPQRRLMKMRPMLRLLSLAPNHHGHGVRTRTSIPFRLTGSQWGHGIAESRSFRFCAQDTYVKRRVVLTRIEVGVESRIRRECKLQYVKPCWVPEAHSLARSAHIARNSSSVYFN